jgi:hypothetical protein
MDHDTNYPRDITIPRALLESQLDVLEHLVKRVHWHANDTEFQQLCMLKIGQIAKTLKAPGESMVEVLDALNDEKDRRYMRSLMAATIASGLIQSDYTLPNVARMAVQQTDLLLAELSAGSASLLKPEPNSAASVAEKRE